MKKIILSIVGVLAVLWVAMFVTDMKILVGEVSPNQNWKQCQVEKEATKDFDDSLKKLFFCDHNQDWGCTYITARSSVKRFYSEQYYDSCPIIRFGASP
jgi:hypothetical protein